MARKQKIDTKWLYDMYVKEQKSGVAIAKQIGCSKDAVYNILKRDGIQKRKRTSKYPLLNDTQWILEQYKSKSIRQISIEFGIPIGVIHSALKSRGIKTRGYKDSLRLRYPNGRNGSLSSNWKGGISKIAHNIRTSTKYKEWRLKVLYRDEYVCVNCGKYGKEVDHIKQFSQILQENNIENRQQANECNGLWDVKNGRTLCHKCHVNTPTHSRKIKK